MSTPSSFPTFDPTRVGIVATANGNLLIRGNFPLNSSNQWAWSQLSAVLKQQGYDLSTYQLVDIAILDNTGELPMLTAELQTFGLSNTQAPFNDSYPPYAHDSTWNPSTPYGTTLSGTDNGSSYPATFLWWPLETQPDTNFTDSTWDSYLQPAWSGSGTTFYPVGYGFDALVSYLTEQIGQTPDTPLAIYYHCSEGTDRTGAVTAGYLLNANPSLTASQAITNATALIPAGVPPVADYQDLVNAYYANADGLNE